MKVGVIPLLLSRGGLLVINDKIDRERGTFESNIDIKDSIDWWKFKEIYDNMVKIDI